MLSVFDYKLTFAKTYPSEEESQESILVVGTKGTNNGVDVPVQVVFLRIVNQVVQTASILIGNENKRKIRAQEAVIEAHVVDLIAFLRMPRGFC